MSERYQKWLFALAALVILLLLSMWVSLTFGEINLWPHEIFTLLKNKTGIEYTILSNIRIPRIILGFAVGGALSLSGVILQGVYRNPLVEPYTLGISGGASLGVALVIVSGLSTALGSLLLPIAGFFGAGITIFLVYFLSMRNNHLNINKMLLIGVMVSFIASSAVMFLMSTTTTENVHTIVFWTMGSLDTGNVLLIRIVFFTAVSGLIISYLFVNQLNALRLGVIKAGHLGINTRAAIRMLFIVASLLTGISVSVVGVIGFVGLIVPHMLRMIVGTDYRILLISSFLGGGIFILLSDLLARTVIAPNELPIGVITGIIGGVVFIIALSKSKIH